MLLPQLITRSRFTFAVPAVAVAILIALLPAPVRAATEQLGSSPARLGYGDVMVGQNRTLSVSLTNKGRARVEILSVESSDSKFKLSKPKLPTTLKAGEKLELRVTFAPTTKGYAGGQIKVVSNAAHPTLTVGMEGSGVGESSSKPHLTIAPSTLSFGNVAAGTTETLTLGLNTSAGSITISSASSSSSQFELPGATFPLTIAKGKETSINVTFKPAKDGKESATLIFASNAANSRATEPLTGDGTAPYVSLSWDASESATGYNVYRGTSENGTYTKVNSSPDPETSYTDKTIVNGKTYYYATTAVNSSGKESAYSNRVKVVVP
ncbi:MAG: choice-of-anchor D domain-containing protein [Candidatus Sulfotelmatobacter sp.]